MKPQAYLVTGGSAGIGAAIVSALLKAGHRVINIDYRLPEVSPEGLISIQADLTDTAQTQAAVAQARRDHAIIGLVNNAGATRPGTVDTATLEDLDYVFALHLRTAMILAQAVVPDMREAGFGRIVNMSSRAALGKPDRVAYSATKAGLVGMTRTLAMELGADGITVNAIGPGPIATDLFRNSNPDGAPQTQRIINSIVVKRLGTPEDVARAAMFFLSPDNGFVTGQMLYVCGGTTLGVAPI
ncbi:SDR family NAD(P)-dependent oxidoreductase [Bordetella sp. 02P26C-1]|uniref:SDR family NAD(P)-dependent oxidoreductase n=1 Tax=Bordetella sp. 02P26C-1 TaxID=2683195 RepID=UPI0013547489|nr:SDR family oxidoreductase [Bordetella sp. 02P26C-1]MVW79260.1 SDR family oxidoreductase [Bordetella sp. 02P26C-1]